MCNFTSIWKDALQTHIQNFHDGVITHFCNDCDFTTDSINSLKQHKVVTHGAQRIFCPEDGCSYNAKWKADVKKHVLSVHQGVRYPCDQCDYQATEKRHLKRHVQIHCGKAIKQFPCDLCDYSATETRYLKLHTDSVHNGILYPCSDCDYKATVPKDLKIHRDSIHLGVRKKR